MPEEMSMFKKLKERITDEVNSATNRLQSMQIMDQFASTISQQTRNDPTSNRLPEPMAFNSVSKPTHFSLMDQPVTSFSEEEELNSSDTSPQHQLFNGQAIKRADLQTPLQPYSTRNGLDSSQMNLGQISIPETNDEVTNKNDSQTVINLSELSSDIEDEVDGEGDDEVDLLFDKSNPQDDSLNDNDSSKKPAYVVNYKAKYRDVVHLARKLQRDLMNERGRYQSERNEMNEKLSGLRSELDELRKESGQQESILDLLGLPAQSDSNGSRADNSQPNKPCAKIDNLEKLLAKCKESLKTKNNTIKMLKEALNEVELFKSVIDESKNELNELRAVHETWTVSIAESKQAMHRELESKNTEIAAMKTENSELQSKINEGHERVKQLKSVVQDLESRLVSMSAAHQKERESLTKELNQAKNTAIRQLQKDHELQLERVKLDLEKQIETHKRNSLAKDHQIIKVVEERQKLVESNQALTKELTDSKTECLNQAKELEDMRAKLSEEEVRTKTEANDKIESEYLKNIVYNFLIGNEPLVLMKVISEILKFDKDQVDQIRRVQEAIHLVSKMNN